MQRREFIKLTGAAAGAAAMSGTLIAPAVGAGVSQELRITKRTIEVTGRAAGVYGLLQPDGTHGLVLTAGESFDVQLRNELQENTIIHWHGLTPPWASDGVPDAPLPLMRPGEQRHFNFPVGSGGTHWMHAHTLQEQALLAAPLIVRDADANTRDEQEVVLLLHDFSFTPAAELFASLTGGAAGEGQMQAHGAHSGMAMDLNDLEYDAYLINDRTLDDPEVVDVERNGRVRLRIINGATATAFTIDLGDQSGELIAVDGQPVMPVAGSRFPLTMGQRIDLRLQLRGDEVVPVLALREGSAHRTGIMLRPAGAEVRKVSGQAETSGPVLTLDLENSLRALTPLEERTADKRLEVRLTGDMANYRWAMEAEGPLEVEPEDRVEVTLNNTTMMAHPMHLHGHHFQVVGIGGRRISGAVRDTILVPPMQAVTLAFDAGNPGQWAFHCHHLYHMAAGMMATLAYRT